MCLFSHGIALSLADYWGMGICLLCLTGAFLFLHPTCRKLLSGSAESIFKFIILSLMAGILYVSLVYFRSLYFNYFIVFVFLVMCFLIAFSSEILSSFASSKAKSVRY
jgi:hypothetical protein